VGSASDSAHRVTRTTGARVLRPQRVCHAPRRGRRQQQHHVYGPITTSGDVYTAKVMGIKSGTLTPAINGAGYSQSGIGLMGYIPPRDGYFAISNSSSGAAIAPANSNINLYKTYNVDDNQYNAGLLRR
jgi:hypothetical protein